MYILGDCYSAYHRMDQFNKKIEIKMLEINTNARNNIYM